MPRVAEKRILIPAQATSRPALERALRDDGWLPLPYGDAKDAEQALARAPATAVILDSTGSERKAVELVKTVRRLCPDAFVVGVDDRGGIEGADTVLRAGSTPEEIATAVQVGAAMRDARAVERVLREQLRGIEEQTRTQTERIKELEAMCSTLQTWARAAQELAVRDELTGLYNRRYFTQVSENEIERARRTGAQFAVAMVDIDRFKHYNDAYGHVAGDDILRQFARILLRSLRKMDSVARYGGEEFIMLLPETHGRHKGVFDPERLIERLREAIEKDPTLNGTNRWDAPITISAGVVRYPSDGKTVAELILEADARLFRAKESGRNRVCATRE